MGVLSGCDRLFECGKLFFTVGVDFHGAVLRVGGIVLIEEKCYGAVETFNLRRQYHAFIQNILTLDFGNIGESFVGVGFLLKMCSP